MKIKAKLLLLNNQYLLRSLVKKALVVLQFFPALNYGNLASTLEL